jgi:plastocyanin
MRRLIVPALLSIGGALLAVAVGTPVIEAGGGGHGCVRAPRDGTDEPVVINESCFTPAVLYVEPDTTVEWQQQDFVPHNVTFFNGDVAGEDHELNDGDTVSQTFDAPGVYAYYCTVHPSMLGVVVVGDPASSEFGAALALQTSDSQSQATLENETPPSWAKVTGSAEGVGNDSGARWGEAAIGLGLFGGLLVGLVAVGGGIKLHRRAR